MPTRTITMHPLKECLRLKFECHLPHEQIAHAFGLSRGTVGKYVMRSDHGGPCDHDIVGPISVSRTSRGTSLGGAHSVLARAFDGLLEPIRKHDVIDENRR